SGLSAPLTPVCLLILDRWDRADRLEKEVLTPTVAMVNEPTGPLLLSLADSLLEGIEGEITPERTRHSPPHDTAAESIDDKGHIDEALLGGHIGQIRDPALVQTLGGEVPLHQIERPLSGIARDSGSRLPAAAYCALEAQAPSSGARPYSAPPECPLGSAVARPCARRRPRSSPSRPDRSPLEGSRLAGPERSEAPDHAAAPSGRSRSTQR